MAKKNLSKEQLLELAKKIGIKEENFELGYKENPKALEEQILKGATFMGYV